MVNDFYARFIRPEATEKQKVLVGRLSTVLLMVIAGLFSFYLQSAKDVFSLLLQIGAGTGLLFILRWFWSRINPYSEIAAMAISFVIAVLFFVNGKLETPWFELASHWQLVTGVVITTLGWIIVTLITQPSQQNTINNFNQLIFGNTSKFNGFGYKILAFVIGVLGVYATLFSIGNFIYGKITSACLLLTLVILCCIIIYKTTKKF